jgi:DNA adenine methylase
VTELNGLTGILLDPPYASDRAEVYAHDSTDVAHAAREWAIANGDNPMLRIALCGYEGEHAMPASWDCVAWKTNGGYGNQGDTRGRANADKERIWFSPHCLPASEVQQSLF